MKRHPRRRRRENNNFDMGIIEEGALEKSLNSKKKTPDEIPDGKKYMS